MKEKKGRGAEVRCAIYTRKSTEEGLEQEFNSLDAQRESAEAFIKSQAHEGWVCLKSTYDDGGFTGGNMDRPALQRLMADIEAGKIDCVVVYKVDRLSRSLLDFARMMEIFDRKQISFVSVTQQFNTSTSMGRLILNVLLSFAQFEREMISERTRDKMAAARRKGKYVGGVCMLGYDIDRERKKLVVNELEAEQVRQIFQLYLEHRGLIPVVQELARRGWNSKTHLTLKGESHGGSPFTKTSLHKLLTSVTYRGQVRYRDELYAGEHPAIVEESTWTQVQELLQENAGKRRAVALSTRGLLSGLLRCKNCACKMTLVASGKGGTKRYRYYVCSSAQRKGWSTCPTKSIPAVEIDRYLVAQLHAHSLIGDDFESLPLLAQQELLAGVLSGVDYDGQTKKLSIHLLETSESV